MTSGPSRGLHKGDRSPRMADQARSRAARRAGTPPEYLDAIVIRREALEKTILGSPWGRLPPLRCLRGDRSLVEIRKQFRLRVLRCTIDVRRMCGHDSRRESYGCRATERSRVSA
jgi:hypothetical protein